jgi:hypothetical protein
VNFGISVKNLLTFNSETDFWSQCWVEQQKRLKRTYSGDIGEYQKISNEQIRHFQEVIARGRVVFSAG